MSRRLHTVRDLLLVSLLAWPLLTPLLRWAETACTHDGHLHYHRVVAMLHAWRNGLLFSRWLPDLAFGYGYPFFLYREPLPLYLSLWPHLLGLPLPAAINLFYALCLVASGCFTYLWVRDIFGPRAGLVAAVAYMAAPYQLVDALIRGNQVESMALALFPLILWAGRRFVLAGRARWFLAAALGLAVLALSHNISLLLFAPALVLYLLFCGWLAGLQHRAVLWRAAAVVGLGLAMTAFYTLPAVLEIDQVTLTLSTSNRNNDFRFNFASLAEIFAPVAPEDPALINPPLPLRLGWAPTALALLGLISGLLPRKLSDSLRKKDRITAREKVRSGVVHCPTGGDESPYYEPGTGDESSQYEQRGHVAFMAAGALVYLFFALPISRPLWEAMPLIEFVQFPWRFVGRAALPVAFLAGVPFAAGLWPLPAARLWRAATTILPLALAVAVLLLEAYPLLYPPYCVERAFPTIHDVHAYEQATGMVGVDPVGSYFPVTVAQRPGSSPLLADYAAGRTPQRFDLSALPPGAELLQVSYRPLAVTAELRSPEAFQARYLSFAFPGWRALVDGEPAAITAEEPSGLITFAVPVGQHTVEVSWHSTPLRSALGALSLLATLAVLALALSLRGRPRGRRPAAPSDRPAALSQKAFAALALLALLLLGGKIMLVDRLPSPLRRSADPPVAFAADLQVGGLQLAGFNLSRQAAPSGEAFDVHLAWQVHSAPQLALQSNLWLRDEQGLIWSDRDTQRPRLYEEAPPTQQWLAGQWAWDSREVTILPGAPPGRYELVLTLFNLADLQPLTLLQAGSAAGPTAVIGHVEVLPARTAPVFRPQHGLSEQIDGLLLLGYNQDRDSAAPGDPLLLTFFWERPAAGEPPANMALELRDEAGVVQAQWPIAPPQAAAEWRAGERLRGQHLLRLPARLESGLYGLWLQDVALGHIEVTAPQRLFQAPAVANEVRAHYGGLASLAGYELAPVDSLAALQSGAHAELAVTLVWQALAEMSESYVVFVHLVGEDGSIVAQSDAEPAQWRRPTSGWAPSEYVVDRHVISLPAQLPPGELALRVGLFDPARNVRLPLEDGADSLLLQP